MIKEKINNMKNNFQLFFKIEDDIKNQSYDNAKLLDEFLNKYSDVYVISRSKSFKTIQKSRYAYIRNHLNEFKNLIEECNNFEHKIINELIE